jgi:catechol 2,3-dioxygenase-like lactoylglutathione lyase family enzyme
MSDDRNERVVAVNRGVEAAEGEAPVPGAAHRALDAWIGRWINQGHTLDEDGNPGTAITTSDVYEWAPGGFFVLHTAYGRVGNFGGGGVEIIGYDDASGEYVAYFFDSAGNASVHRLVADGDTWTYLGETTRATVRFSDGDTVQHVLHERTDDGSTYVPSMRVTLVKVP